MRVVLETDRNVAAIAGLPMTVLLLRGHHHACNSHCVTIPRHAAVLQRGRSNLEQSYAAWVVAEWGVQVPTTSHQRDSATSIHLHSSTSTPGPIACASSLVIHCFTAILVGRSRSQLHAASASAVGLFGLLSLESIPPSRRTACIIVKHAAQLRRRIY